MGSDARREAQPPGPALRAVHPGSSVLRLEGVAGHLPLEGMMYMQRAGEWVAYSEVRRYRAAISTGPPQTRTHEQAVGLDLCLLEQSPSEPTYQSATPLRLPTGLSHSADAQTPTRLIPSAWSCRPGGSRSCQRKELVRVGWTRQRGMPVEAAAAVDVSLSEWWFAHRSEDI